MYWSPCDEPDNHVLRCIISPETSSVAYLVSHHRSVGYRERRCGFNTTHQSTELDLSAGSSKPSGSSCTNTKYLDLLMLRRASIYPGRASMIHVRYPVGLSSEVPRRAVARNFCPTLVPGLRSLQATRERRPSTCFSASRPGLGLRLLIRV